MESQAASGKSFIDVLYAPTGIAQVLLLIFVGLFTGYLSKQAHNKLRAQKEQTKEAEDSFLFYKKFNDENIKKNDSLREQILSYEDSLVKIYKWTERLNAIDLESVFYNAVLVAGELMEADKVSIYFVDMNKRYLRLVTKSNVNNFDIPKTIRVESGSLYERIILNDRIFTNTALDSRFPMMAAPLKTHDNVIGIIQLHDVPFEYLSLYHKNMLNVLCGLISGALSRAFDLTKLTANKRYI